MELVANAVRVSTLTDALKQLGFFEQTDRPHFFGKFVVTAGKEEETVLIRSYVEGTTYGLQRYAEVKGNEIDIIETSYISESMVRDLLRQLIVIYTKALLQKRAEERTW